MDDPKSMSAYVDHLVQQKTYLTECFDLATPQSFLLDMATHCYLGSKHVLVLPGGGYSGDILICMQDGYKHYPHKQGIEMVTDILFSQCAIVCDKLISYIQSLRDSGGKFSDSFAQAVQYPKYRPVLRDKTILAKLVALRSSFRTANRSEVDRCGQLLIQAYLSKSPPEPRKIPERLRTIESTLIPANYKLALQHYGL